MYGELDIPVTGSCCQMVVEKFWAKRDESNWCIINYLQHYLGFYNFLFASTSNSIIMQGVLMEESTKLLSLSKAAKILGVCTQSLRLWDKQGKIDMIRTPGGSRKVPVGEINRLLNNRVLKKG